MRFSQLLSQLSEAQAGALPPHFPAHDPELRGASALHQAGPGDLAFLEEGHALATAAATTAAAAVLIPARGEESAELRRQLEARGVAWIALADPRLGFAEALEQLYPTPQPSPGIHPTAVVDPTAQVSSQSHLGAHVVVGARVRIDAGCTLHPHVVLYDDVEIGPGCVLHAGAVVHPGSSLAEGCVLQSNTVIGGEGFGFVPTAAGWRKMPRPAGLCWRQAWRWAAAAASTGRRWARPALALAPRLTIWCISATAFPPVGAAPWPPRWGLLAVPASATASSWPGKWAWPTGP